jgi:hemerythrin superfamily protein
MNRQFQQIDKKEKIMPTKRPTKKRNAQPSDAIALLKADHQEVSALLERFEKSRQDTVKGDVAQRICLALTVHAKIEEEIFYPAVREAVDDDDLIDEATVEHASLKTLIGQIQAARPGSGLFDAKVTVLGEYVKHHVKEEQQEMFPKARKSGVDLKALGARLQQRKEELMSR